MACLHLVKASSLLNFLRRILATLGFNTRTKQLHGPVYLGQKLSYKYSTWTSPTPHHFISAYLYRFSKIANTIFWRRLFIVLKLLPHCIHFTTCGEALSFHLLCVWPGGQSLHSSPRSWVRLYHSATETFSCPFDLIPFGGDKSLQPVLIKFSGRSVISTFNLND